MAVMLEPVLSSPFNNLSFSLYRPFFLFVSLSSASTFFFLCKAKLYWEREKERECEFFWTTMEFSSSKWVFNVCFFLLLFVFIVHDEAMASSQISQFRYFTVFVIFKVFFVSLFCFVWSRIVLFFVFSYIVWFFEITKKLVENA